MTLTSDNYFDNTGHLSVSQFRDWESCPAMALAIARGEWQKPMTDALLFGKYVDYALTEPEELERFISATPSMLKQDGTLKATYKLADQCVETVRKSPAMAYLDGDAQVILQGEIDGVPWKGKLDCVHREHGVFVDLKTTRSLGWYFEPSAKKRVIWYHKYWTQLTVYRELLRQNYGGNWEPVLLGVSKQEPPALRGVVFSTNDPKIEARLNAELEHVQDYQQQIMSMYNSGHAEACHDWDNCEYCRGHAGFDLELAQV